MRKLFFGIMLLLLTKGSILAQGSISGTLLDESSAEPLIGATVLVKETGNGTATDFDGKYQITAIPAG
ncbi:MAG: carboxypeptidase-like regulatory domain-containing protein, partial [Bacteroidota bacterium]